MNIDIKKLVDAFLGWPLPKDFAPDCGISFDGRKDDEWNKGKTWPIGTNLLTAEQAEGMFRYVLQQVHGNVQEPVAEVTCDGVLDVRFYENCGYGTQLPVGTKLYAAAPQVAQEEGARK